MVSRKRKIGNQIEYFISVSWQLGALTLVLFATYCLLRATLPIPNDRLWFIFFLKKLVLIVISFKKFLILFL